MADIIEFTRVPKQKTVNFRISDKMYKQLEDIAEKEELPVSSIVRQLVSYGIKKIHENRKKKKSKRDN